MNKIKVAILDDHKIVRDGLKAIIFGNDNYRIIIEAGSAKELKELMTEDNIPEILLLDINLPDAYGLDLIPSLMINYPSLKVLVLSSNYSEEILTESIQAGALGYLNKDSSGSELLQALEEIQNGDPYFGKNMTSIIFKQFSTMVKNSIQDELQISSKEKEIISMLSIGMTSKDIADKLCLSHRTVETHKRKIMEKLNVKNTVELISFAYKNGLIQK